MTASWERFSFRLRGLVFFSFPVLDRNHLRRLFRICRPGAFRPGAFTLTELLVSVAIVAILARLGYSGVFEGQRHRVKGQMHGKPEKPARQLRCIHSRSWALAAAA